MEENLKTGSRTGTLEAAGDFARAIGASLPFQAYEKALGDIREDMEARALLAEYQQAQQSRRLLQSWSGNSGHNEQFHELEKKVFEDPKLHAYFDKQEKLVSLMQDLNKSLREELGFDFARLARPASGCC